MLHRLLVVELASVLAGPSVGQFFAEHGARVIKIENPRTGGDVTRSWHRSDERPDQDASYFAACNYGKESVALDLRHPDCFDTVRRLVTNADVLISSYAPGSADRLGLGDATLADWNPRLIHAKVSGYGPDHARSGYDAVIQAESGFMSINGQADGPATKMPVALIDILAAHHLKEAILVALLNRSGTGVGECVSVSLMDAAYASLANQGTGWLATGNTPSRSGSIHPNIAPYGLVLETRDDARVLLAVGTDAQFSSLCALLGTPELATDERFLDNASRVVHRHVLGELLAPLVASRTSKDFLTKLSAGGVPAGQVKTIPEALSSTAAKRLILGGSTRLPGLKQLVTQSMGASLPLSGLPRLGEHTNQVIMEFSGLGTLQIERLAEAGSIVN